MQLLEGQRERVLALYDRIRNDTRHTDCRLVLESPVTMRGFRDWGMVMPGLPMAGPDGVKEPDHRITLFDVAADPRFCYDFITAHAQTIGS